MSNSAGKYMQIFLLIIIIINSFLFHNFLINNLNQVVSFFNGNFILNILKTKLY